MTFDYDLFVIGAGPGGLAAAEQVAGYGARVAIAEQNLVGGTCVIRGCIPEKLMCFAAGFSDLYQDGVGYGWSKAHSTFDWHQFMAAKDQEIHRLAKVHIQSLEEAGVELIQGRATFLDAHTLEVVGRQITAEKILIAVGGEAVKPEIPGIEHAISARELFDLKQQPKHIAVMGGDYIAVKLAGIMNGLGSQVTQMLHEDHILSGFDEDICSAVTEEMTKRGIQILNNTAVKKIEQEQDDLHLTLSGTCPNTLSIDTVLYVAGHAPNLSGLNLEKAGVKVTRSRNCYAHVDAIAVDANSRTTQPNIFAVGDCTNRLQFTPVVIASARAFANTEFGNNPETVSYEYVPATVSSHPEAATVGMTEAEAREKLGDSVRCYRTRFRPLFNSLAKRDEKTLIKLVVDSTSERVLGAHMVGAGAVEIIQCLALALRMGATKKDFDATIGIHPSVAEEFLTLR